MPNPNPPAAGRFKPGNQAAAKPPEEHARPLSITLSPSLATAIDILADLWGVSRSACIERLCGWGMNLYSRGNESE